MLSYALNNIQFLSDEYFVEMVLYWCQKLSA